MEKQVPFNSNTDSFLPSEGSRTKKENLTSNRQQHKARNNRN